MSDEPITYGKSPQTVYACECGCDLPMNVIKGTKGLKGFGMKPMMEECCCCPWCPCCLLWEGLKSKTLTSDPRVITRIRGYDNLCATTPNPTTIDQNLSLLDCPCFGSLFLLIVLVRLPSKHSAGCPILLYNTPAPTAAGIVEFTEQFCKRQS